MGPMGPWAHTAMGPWSLGPRSPMDLQAQGSSNPTLPMGPMESTDRGPHGSIAMAMA